MKRIIGLYFLIVGISFSAYAQVDSIALHYASEIKISSAKKHLNILASDEFEGRDTGKPGGKKAAQYIADEFKKIGLLPSLNGSYFQEVPLAEPLFGVKEFIVNNQHLEVGKDFFISGSSAQKSLSTNEIVFIGIGTNKEESLKTSDIKDKVVMLFDQRNLHKNEENPFPDESIRRSKLIQNLLKKKPALILLASANVPKLADAFVGPSRRIILRENYKEVKSNDAIAYISPETTRLFLNSSKFEYQNLIDTIKGRESISFTFHSNFETTFGISPNDFQSPNVLGYLEGSDLKDELIVVSAHYDHLGIGPKGEIFYGADDDASGVTALLEMAYAFSKGKKEGHGARRSILFLAVTGEEKGLLGSDYYTKRPIFPLENTIANLNIDMIGRTDPRHEGKADYVYVVGSDRLSSTLHEINENANTNYTQLDIDYKYNDPNDPERIYYRSDHYNFAKNGIPVIFYFNGVHADYHQPTDTVDKIEFEQLVKRTKLIFHTAWELVNREERLTLD